MSWLEQLNKDSLPWLLEPDTPGVRYLALRELLDAPDDSLELQTAREQAHTTGPIGTVLAKMDEGGFWVEPGPGYYPKYRGSVWSILMLAQLGASVAMDERIQRACANLLEHSLTGNGQFTTSGTPSSTADCLQGNLCSAMIDLGFDASRLDKAFEWMARSLTSDGVAPAEDKRAPLRYYAGKCGPGFACGANNKLPCAWGAVKVMLAFSKLSPDRRTPLIQTAIQQGVDFLFSVEPASAEYPAGWNDKPSRNWWKFGFPVFYVTDLLQLAEALVRLGYGEERRLQTTLDLIRKKQDDDGRWNLEYDYTGKTWINFGPKKQPNKWVTLRALNVLKHCQT